MGGSCLLFDVTAPPTPPTRLGMTDSKARLSPFPVPAGQQPPPGPVPVPITIECLSQKEDNLVWLGVD